MNLINKLKPKNLSASFWGYALVILAIIAPWFLKPGYLFMTDMVWGPKINLDWTGSWFLFNLLVKSLSFIFPIDFLEKIFISGVLILILLGGSLLTKTILEFDEVEMAVPAAPARGLVFILSLFALFNPFVYDRALYGQFGVILSYGCLLFVAAYLLRVYRNLDFKSLYAAAIFTALALLFSVHFIFLLAPFYILFLGALFLKRQEIKAGGKSKKFWLALFFSFLIVLIINANWLLAIAVKASPLATFVQQGITAQDLAAFQTAGKTPLQTFTNVLLMSGFWGKDQFRYFDLTTAPNWQFSFIFLAPVIFYGVYLSFRRRSRREKIMSAVLLVIFSLAVYLAVGIKSPLTGGLTIFLYNYLPLYKGLREPQKWVAVIIPIYLFYLTLGTRRLKDSKLISKNIPVSAFIFSAVIIMAAPSLFWSFNRQAVPTPYPQDWYSVNQLLLNRSAQSYGCNDRILFLPWHMYMSFNWVGKIIANPASTFFSCPVLSGTNMEWGGIYDNSRSVDGAAVSAWLAAQGKSGSPVLSVTPIRYIILAKELDFRSYLWINNLSYIRPLLETPTLLVYEIKP
ncbi:MAG: hypothetical protein WC249_01955 [Patescibacteria group bacterium]|jgi:hypothetical protein